MSTPQPSEPQRHSHPMGRFASSFYVNRRLIVLTILLAVASGVSSLSLLPRMEDPILRQRAANITTVFPGADAERVEALVTEKIEDQLLDIPEIKRLRSQSRAGISFVSVELRDDIYDTDPVWSSIRGKLEDSISSLPDGAERPVFNELNIAAYAWIGAVVWDRDEPVAQGVLRRVARELKDTLFAVEGTKEVDLYGDPKEEIVVEIDPDRAASVGLSAASIARQLVSGDVKQSAGMLRGDRSEIVVELRNQFYSTDDILQATLRTEDRGQTLSLGDVATVRRTTPEPPAAVAIIDGRPGVVVSVMLRPNYRIDQWAAAAERKITEFAGNLSTGLSLDVIMEQERYVSDRMNSLLRNLLMGISAVALVTFLFLGWRSSLLVTATLPLASFMVLWGMRLLEIPIHQMSITGLILALGLLIDNAIIAADEIAISLRRGLSPRSAVEDMVSRLFAPLLASTATTAFAFAPIALMEGPAGEFVGSIAITVMLAIFSSFFLAMTILPATAAWLQKNVAAPHHAAGVVSEGDSATTRPDHPSFWRRLVQHGVQFDAMTAAYRRLLRGMLKRPVLGIAAGVVLPIAGFVAATQLQEQFFPPADRDQFYIELELAPQATLSQTRELAGRVDECLKQEARIRHTTWFLGESAPPFYYNIVARRKNTPNYGQAIVTLNDNRNSLALIRKLQTDLDREFPTARLLVRQLEQGPPFDAPVEMRLFGSDLAQLHEIGEELRAIATTLPNLLHVRTGMNDTRPVASIDVDSQQASWAGLTEADIANQLFARLEGLQAGTIIEEVEEIPVKVRIADQRRMQVEDLNDTGLFVGVGGQGSNGSGATTSGVGTPREIPVSSVASIRLESQRALITRYNGRRINEVQGFITAGTLPSTVLAAFDAKINEAGIRERLPMGFTLEYGGEASERDAAVGRLMANVTMLAIAMVASLVLALASFRLAGLIGLVAILSIGLGMGALWVFGYPFGFMAIVGTMGLVGIAINDSIVVVAALRDNEGVQAGDLEATVETVVEVSRHILATSATTVVGFLPLVLGGGGFWPPLAVAIGTGVTGATLISLTLVPSVIRLMTNRREPAAESASVG